MSHATMQRREESRLRASLFVLASSAGNVGFPLLIALFLILAIRPLCAHEDPNGDVYPIVSVEKSDFVVSFYNNSALWKDVLPNDLPSYKTIIDINGRVIKKREPLQSFPIRVEAWPTEIGKNVYFSTDSSYPTHVRLIWPGRSITMLGSSASSYGEFLVCHISGEKYGNQHPFFLAKVNQITGLIQSIELGNPERTAGVSPIASEIRIISGKAYIAWVWRGILLHTAVPEKEFYLHPPRGCWISDRDFNYRYVTRLVLSRWDLQSNSVEHFLLSDRIDGNTSISMNAIGNNLLIAWHFGIPSGVPNSRILMRLVRIPDLPNSPQLLPSLDFSPPLFPLPKFSFSK